MRETGAGVRAESHLAAVNNFCLKVFAFGATTMMRDEKVSVQVPAKDLIAGASGLTA